MAAIDESEETNRDENDEETKKAISFRNYAPSDNKLEESNDNEDTPAAKKQRVDENRQSSALQQAMREAQSDAVAAGSTSSIQANGDLEMSSMAPKKINWDLKRDIRDKLAKLEKRTQKAIVELLKERLEHEAAEQASSDDSDLD